MRRFLTTIWCASATVVLLSSSFVWAKPRVASATVRLGRSPRVLADGWATLHYRIENPDDTPAECRLTLESDRGGTAVFEKTISIGPKSFLRGRELVIGARGDEYRVSLSQGDRVVHRDTALVRADSSTKARLFVLNDSADFVGVSTLARTRALIKQATHTSLPAREAPCHWLAYDTAQAVVVGIPEFSEMSSLQFEALRNYVARGGNLVFVDPQGTLAAAGTPLRDLLPVTPLRVRQVEDCPALDAWGEHQAALITSADEKLDGPRPVLADEEGLPFLESVPRTGAITSLRSSEFPIISWRRFGIGRVGVIAMNPCTDLMWSSRCAFAVWNHILSWTHPAFSLSDPRNGRALPEIISLLTGFKIPKVGVIKWILLGYLAGILAALTIGFRTGRNTTAWLVAAVIGTATTAGIFLYAFQRNADRPARSATILNLRTSTAEQRSGCAAISLLSKSDCRPTITATHHESAFRVLPKPSTFGKYRRTAMAPKLRVHRVNSLPSTPRINIQALKPRTFATSYNAPVAQVPKPVQVTLTANGPDLQGWECPPWAKTRDTEAFALLPSGCARITINGNRLSHLNLGQDRVDLNLVNAEFRTYFASGLLPWPGIALLTPWNDAQHELPVELKDFSRRGYVVDFLPMSIRVERGPFVIPPQMIAVRRVGQLSRQVRQHDQWVRNVLRNKSREFCLEAILPAFLADVVPLTVDITLDATNPGGNLEFSIGLLPNNIPIRETIPPPWQATIQPSETSGQRFVFGELPPGKLVDPIIGRIRLLLQARQKQLIADLLETERTNAWKVNTLRISVTAQLPPDATARRF